jgi:hypothetical protein
MSEELRPVDRWNMRSRATLHEDTPARDSTSDVQACPVGVPIPISPWWRGGGDEA